MKRFAEIDSAMTVKMVRASEDYACCPNSRCKSFGVVETRCCAKDFECTDCGTKWRMPGQDALMSTTNVLWRWVISLVEKLYNSNTYSDIYKVMFAQMCPSCKVMIVRSEGCKFMECGKCRFQFCWNCLEEFYTEQHMYYSTCPLRIVMIYAMLALPFIVFMIKFIYTFTTVS